MKRLFTLVFFLCAFLSAVVSARTWTNTEGKKIEAELLRVEGEKVILKFRGREVKLSINKLSQGDQDYIKEWKEENQDGVPSEDDSAPDDIELCGTKLQVGGHINEVQAPLSEKVLKKYAKATKKPSQVKMAIALPKGFDPKKPQRVMWVSAAINNEKERTRGNIGAIRIFAKTAVNAGWVVIAADTDLGNPDFADDQRSGGGDFAVHTQAIEILAAAWPDFKNWQFACCGHSGGAKASFYRTCYLLASDLNVIGLYLSGCNEDWTERARKETHARKSKLRKIKVFISNGKKDKISTLDHAEALKKSVKSHRYGKIRMEFFDGGHQMNREEFTKALKWFIEADQ